jgi:hypothetical protein
MLTHVWPRSSMLKLRMNYELIKNELEVNWNLTISLLEVN